MTKKSLLLLVWLPLISSCHRPMFVTSDFTSTGFTEGIEGPMYNENDNCVYLVNYDHEGTIGKIDATGNCSVFVELPSGSIGNGIRFDSENNMYVADYKSHSILKINMQSKIITTHAHNDNMNQPNDLTMMKNGIIFCSDPNWKNGDGKLWRINVDGTAQLLEDHMGTTNGIELSPDETTLYVNESIQRKLWSYNVDKKGGLSNKKLLITFDTGGMDGMKCDKDGNLWIARYDMGNVTKVSPTGQVQQEISLKGKKPTNLTFGGKNKKKVFVTLQDRRLVETFSIK